MVIINRKGKVRILTIAQVVLGVLVMVLTLKIGQDVKIGINEARAVDHLTMISNEELDNIQRKIEEYRSGVTHTDLYNTEINSEEDITYIGRINIPKLSVNEAIVLGTSEDNLKVGVGVLEGLDIPLGTEGEVSIIAGNRGYLYRRDIFKELDKLEVGDIIEIGIGTKNLTYEVFNVREYKMKSSDKLRTDECDTYLALVTSSISYTKTGDSFVVEAELVN